jgi:exonuclease SbcD
VAKIAHISDLHIGAKMGQFSQNSDIKSVLDNIVEQFREYHIMLISGDIFDNHSPSSESEEIYYNFLYKLSNNGLKVFIISGNHDNETRLTAPKQFLEERGVYLFSSENYKPFPLTVGDEEFTILPIPYLSDLKVTKEFLKVEDEVERNRVYGESFSKIVSEMVEDSDPDSCLIALSHSFVNSGESGSSERLIQRGNIDLIDVLKLPKEVDYYAFGHLHRFQPVGNNGYYSGSIIPISIDEGSYDKRVVQIETENSKIISRTTYKIPQPSIYRQISGNFQELREEIEKLSDGYISIDFNGVPTLSEGEQIIELAEERNLKIVFQKFNREDDEVKKREFKFENRSIDELFLKYIDENENLEHREAVLELFSRVVNEVS